MRTTAHILVPTTRSTARRLAARLLVATSRLLSRVAQWLHAERRLPPGEPVLEFHAEAGAPEGALYLDGQLVGHIPGVTRL
ncbi:hypothetical protein [Rubrivivax gelatinosus]|uniref:Uncharacterized protein n=1 Tax=Rubrivivax gelatinosus TaxID=28068 RepID=A0A4V2SGC6_RUBGE|nr:hypothetical protein [Rubrivivax gelatinosus]MBK1688456.1 hypothetical protein [Rubrivivax gelatinosus]TCP00748.1 hypothetical protein EV684_112186 [Rubrivivax gelatinosus]